jgi:hypothetical protein
MTFQKDGFLLELIKYFFIAIIPVCYLVTPYLVLVLVFLICLIYNHTFKSKHESSFIIIFLFCTLFSGFSFLGVRPYDWVIIFAFIELLLNRQRIKVRLDMLAFFGMVVLVFLLNYHDYSPIAIVRFLFSLILLLILMNKKKIFPSDKSAFRDIIICCIYFSITIYLFTQMGLINNIKSGLLTTNLYLFDKEVRMNGFFSDPNKYMSFVFIFILIVELFLEKEKRRTLILLASIAAVLSLSRTAILVLMIYFIGKVTLGSKKYRAVLKATLITGIMLFAMLILIFPTELSELGNDFFTWTSEVLGREQTLKQNQSLAEDNRILIWTSAMYFILQSPIIGHGWLSFKDLLSYPTHNTILSLLLDGGLFALISYIFLFRQLFFNRYWPIIIPLIIIPLVTLDLSDYRMEFFLLGLLWNQQLMRKNNNSNELSPYQQ